MNSSDRFTVEKVFYGPIPVIRAKCPKCKEWGFIGTNNRCQHCGIVLPEIADRVIYRRESLMLNRMQLPKRLQKELLNIQDYNCFWCGLSFFDEMLNSKTGKCVVPSIHFDHIVPYCYSGNLAGNWVASCSICNQIKHSKYFRTYEEAYEYINNKREQKGWPATFF